MQEQNGMYRTAVDHKGDTLIKGTDFQKRGRRHGSDLCLKWKNEKSNAI